MAHTVGSLVGVRDSIAIANLGKGKGDEDGFTRWSTKGKRTEVDAKLSNRASKLTLGVFSTRSEEHSTPISYDRSLRLYAQFLYLVYRRIPIDKLCHPEVLWRLLVLPGAATTCPRRITYTY